MLLDVIITMIAVVFTAAFMQRTQPFTIPIHADTDIIVGTLVN